MSRKKHRDSVVKQNKNTNQQPNNPLFSEVDAKSVEVSGYTLGHGAPQIDKSMHEHSIPTGVVDIDESVVFPTSSLNSDRQYDSKSSKSAQHSHSHRHDRKHVHLPPIIHHHHQHYPYEYYIQPNYHPSDHLYNSHPIHYRHQSFHHHHHHRHRHHKHGGTYDPRWWYMPINSVHEPRSRRFIDHDHHHHHYRPPKWYELPSRH